MAERFFTKAIPPRVGIGSDLDDHSSTFASRRLCVGEGIDGTAVTIMNRSTAAGSEKVDAWAKRRVVSAQGAGQRGGFEDAARLQESMLAPIEKRVLIWLARRMPNRVTPDLLTALGLTAMLMAGASYALARWWSPALLLVNVWLAINWFGDSLDGTLARVRNKQRPRYGFYVDHVIDTIGALAIVGGLALSGLMTPLLALAMLCGFYMLSINTYLAAYSLRVFRLSFWKFSPTEMRILLAIGNVVALDRPLVRVLGERHLFFDVSGGIATAVMLIIFAFAVLRNTIALYRAERV